MGAELIEMLMAPNSIVETLDVIEDFRLGLSPCAVNPPFDPFALEVAEERLHHRVIPTVAPDQSNTLTVPNEGNF
jgi:hypothetical protein